jgi:hypothetical protein
MSDIEPLHYGSLTRTLADTMRAQAARLAEAA